MDTWWEDSEKRLTAHTMPCCSNRATVDDLLYDFVQGFSLWSLECFNANKGIFVKEEQQQIEKLLDSRIRIIYGRI